MKGEKNEVSIRLAGADELERILEIDDDAGKRFDGSYLIDETIDQQFPRDKLARLIELDQVWLLTVGERSAVGMVIISVWDNDIYIEQLSVLREYGGQGFGTRLIEHVTQWGCENNFRSIALSTFDEVPWNGPFYRELGFINVPARHWTDQMKEVRHFELESGLRIDRRVFMTKTLK